MHEEKAPPVADNPGKVEAALEYTIFASRWLQAPLYIGLILAQAVYVYKFMLELIHLLTTATTLSETGVMLLVLGLVDVVMIANLLVMVIVGGYETFVSKLPLTSHPDKPEWLNNVDAGVLKVKLASALVSISSIHLLKSFINIAHMTSIELAWQVAIHATFLLSAYTLSSIEKHT